MLLRAHSFPSSSEFAEGLPERPRRGSYPVSLADKLLCSAHKPDSFFEELFNPAMLSSWLPETDDLESVSSLLMQAAKSSAGAMQFTAWALLRPLISLVGNRRTASMIRNVILTILEAGVQALADDEALLVEQEHELNVIANLVSNIVCDANESPSLRGHGFRVVSVLLGIDSILPLLMEREVFDRLFDALDKINYSNLNTASVAEQHFCLEIVNVATQVAEWDMQVSISI